MVENTDEEHNDSHDNDGGMAGEDENKNEELTMEAITTNLSQIRRPIHKRTEGGGHLYTGIGPFTLKSERISTLRQRYESLH